MRRAERIVVTSGKGGVGKTTIVANVGAQIAKGGEKVCLVDADIGLRNLDIVLGLENKIVYTIMDVINGFADVEKVLIRHPRMKNLYLLPASQIATKEMVNPSDFSRVVDELSEDFDYIIIDSPAGIERGFKNSIMVAEKAIVVVNPELPSITDADRVMGILEAEGLQSHGIKVIINRIKLNLLKNGKLLGREEIENALSSDVIGMIPDSDDVILSVNEGVPVVFNGNLKVSKVFENIVNRMKGERIPIEEDLKIFEREGIFYRFVSFLSKRRR